MTFHKGFLKDFLKTIWLCWIFVAVLGFSLVVVSQGHFVGVLGLLFAMVLLCLTGSRVQTQ